ncbi:MAG: lytic transglycosylase domain-containing protein [Actinomycetota bacterium]
MSRTWRVIAIVAAAVLVLGLAAVGGFLALGGLDRWRDSQAIVIPEQYRPVIKEAAKRCKAVPARVLAAQLASESSWDPRAVSPAGAQGIAQFMPEVWAQYGVDGDGDGSADVWNPIDAIHSAAELNCVNRKLVADVPGDELRNVLAAYNAGFNQVVKYQGVPPFPETQEYVERVLRRAEHVEL